jgi:hypothetical protein
MTKIEKRLVELCRGDEFLGRRLFDSRDVIEAVNDPRWEDDVTRHDDWRNYLNEVVADLWEHLSFESRLIAYINACQAAFDDQLSDDMDFR